MSGYMTEEEMMERIRDPEQAIEYLLHVDETGDILDLKVAVGKVRTAQENPKKWEGGS